MFKNDLVNISLKSSQINLPYLYEKKNDIISLIESNNYNIDPRFIKLFIRYDYIGNIFSMSVSNYVEYINKQYVKYSSYIGEGTLAVLAPIIIYILYIK